MNEAVELGRLLHDTPDLFPWVCLAIVLIVIMAQHKRILAYFDARIEAYTAKKQSDAVMAELVRNNTAALENNTAMLSILKQDRLKSIDVIESHEIMSKERMAHIQTVVNRIDTIVQENHSDIMLIADRTGIARKEFKKYE